MAQHSTIRIHQAQLTTTYNCTCSPKSEVICNAPNDNSIYCYTCESGVDVARRIKLHRLDRNLTAFIVN